jgi:hypothetical protein
MRSKPTMFKTAVMEERIGHPWGFIAGLLAFAALVSGGYVLLI